MDTSTLQPDRLVRSDSGDFQDIDASGNVLTTYGKLGGVVYRTVADGTAHTSSTTETLLGSFSIPANTLVVGSVVEVEYMGIATASTNSDTLTVKLYIGGLTGTALLTGTATDTAANNIFSGKCTLVVRTIGTAGTFVAHGHHTDVPAASGTATIGIAERTASTAINTETAQVIGVGADWSTADTNNSCKLEILVVKIY